MNKNSIKKNILGKSGIEISMIGLGLWPAGGDEWAGIDDKEILEAIDVALDNGVTFFDTADIYGKGHSEKLLGRAMKGRRDKFVVASKVGWDGFDRENQVTAYDTPEKLIKSVEGSLKRLDTDYLDVLQSHINFQDPTMEIFLESFQKMEKDGKIVCYGTSTSDFDYLKAFNEDNNCATLQIDYSILNRTPEKDIFPYCLANNIGVIVRGPLAMGILTGKYNENTRFSDGDFRQRWHNNSEEFEIYLQDLQKVNELNSLTNNISLAQLALQFVLSHPAVTTIIPGARNAGQVERNISVATLPTLTDDQLMKIESVTPKSGGRKIWPA